MADKQLTLKLEQYRDALATFLDRLREDRNILAAVLVGSLSDETIWWKESIGLWIIEADGVTKRLNSDGNDEDIHRILAEEGVNIHAELIPRSRFKRIVEGTSRTAFSCNFFEQRELVYCNDPSIKKWFAAANKAATKDREKELLSVTTWAIHAGRHARKRLEVKEDLDLCKQNVIWAAHAIAAIEVVQRGEVYEREWIYRAIEFKPDLFQVIYLDIVSKRRTKKSLRTALDSIDQYLDGCWKRNLKPLLHYLKKRNCLVPLTEMSEHFAYSQLYPWHLESACEWLEQKGHVEKLSAPLKLTKKSRVDVEEPAYMLMG